MFGYELRRDAKLIESYLTGVPNDQLEIVAISVSDPRPGPQVFRTSAATAGTEHLLSDPQLFAILVSHELREPVSAIQSFLNVVIHERTGPLNALQSEFLRTAEVSARRLARRIDDLQVVLAGGDALELRFKDVDVNEQVTLCCRELGWAEERYSVTLDPQLENADGSGVCWADPDRVDQILLNLIENAIKYAHEGSTVQIRSRRSDAQHWEIVIENSSDVSLDADVPSWFEPYRRAEQARSLKRSGLGLGLTIAQFLVHALGGEIWASASNGTVEVGFKLPCDPASLERQSPSTPPTHLHSL
jgi:signal transduction histidine kinase